MAGWEGDPIWVKDITGHDLWETLHPVSAPSVRRVRVGGGWVVTVEYLRSPPCCCFVPDTPELPNGEH